MNKQRKYKNGKLVSRGIEWTDYTWNPVGGCYHRCKWEMADGTIADCYAKDTAEGIAQYPQGFEYHYWNPTRLDEPLRVKKPSKIFLDSMSDLMGHWVLDEQIFQVLDTVRQAHWHTFQLLTKNPKRLLDFRHHFPVNLWVGASMPPDFMNGDQLSTAQQDNMLHIALDTLAKLDNITFMSFEPLSWDVFEIAGDYPGALDWAIIGAATKGKKAYQPHQMHIVELLKVLNRDNVPVFFKGNLKWKTRREEYPKSKT